MTANRIDHYTRVTADIILQREFGVRPWHQPMQVPNATLPHPVGIDEEGFRPKGTRYPDQRFPKVDSRHQARTARLDDGVERSLSARNTGLVAEKATGL